MSIRALAGLCLALGLVIATPGSADAHPPTGGGLGLKGRAEKARERRKEAREERRENREERREARENRRKARREVVGARRALVAARLGGASPEELQKRADELIAARKDLVQARKAARQVRREQLGEYLKDARPNLSRAAMRAELARHARRTAYLARVREVARENNDTAAVTAVDNAMAREQNRHQVSMEWLTGHAGPPAGTDQPAGTEAGE